MSEHLGIDKISLYRLDADRPQGYAKRGQESQAMTLEFPIQVSRLLSHASASRPLHRWTPAAAGDHPFSHRACCWPWRGFASPIAVRGYLYSLFAVFAALCAGGWAGSGVVVATAA